MRSPVRCAARTTPMRRRSWTCGPTCCVAGTGPSRWPRSATSIDRVSAMPEERDRRRRGRRARSWARSTSRPTTFSPINLEPVVQVVSPHVLPEFRRHGIGSALMQAAVEFAEELGIAHVGVAVVRRRARLQPVHGPALARPGGDAAGRPDRAPSRTGSTPATGRCWPAAAPASSPRCWPPAGRPAASAPATTSLTVGAAQPPKRSAGSRRAGDPGGADPAALLVADDHLVRRHRAAEVDRGRDAGDRARRSRPGGGWR